jgi:hypothetical protein
MLVPNLGRLPDVVRAVEIHEMMHCRWRRVCEFGRPGRAVEPRQPLPGLRLSATVAPHGVHLVHRQPRTFMMTTWDESMIYVLEEGTWATR